MSRQNLSQLSFLGYSEVTGTENIVLGGFCGQKVGRNICGASVALIYYTLLT